MAVQIINVGVFVGVDEVVVEVDEVVVEVDGFRGLDTRELTEERY